jgi:hypothetical protein
MRSALCGPASKRLGEGDDEEGTDLEEEEEKDEEEEEQEEEEEEEEEAPEEGGAPEDEDMRSALCGPASKRLGEGDE